MAPSKKSSNGRSPLVNQQRQITAFFGQRPQSSSPSPPPPILTKNKPNPEPSSPDLSPSLITPSSLNSKLKKPPLAISPSSVTPSPTLESKRSNRPVLVIGANVAAAKPSSDKKPYGPEVVNRRVKVYWPLDKSWYEGCVKSYDKVSGKHLVQYDDAEEEMLDLAKEKVEWIEETENKNKKFRRLRRISVVEDDGEEEEGVNDLEDDDWKEKGAVEDDGDGGSVEDMDLDEEEEESGRSGSRKSRKRRVGEGEKEKL